MNYFAKITSAYWVEKNNLEKEARQMAFSMDRQMLSDDQEKKLYIKELRSRIEELNAKHKRCKPLRAETDNSHTEESDTYIQVGQVFHMTIYRARHER